MNETKGIPAMLTIDETAKHFGLPKNFCRSAVLAKKVVFVRVGRKYLINTEKFAEWLNTGEQQNIKEGDYTVCERINHIDGR